MSDDGGDQLNDPRAHAAMRRAFSASYRLPRNFPGFGADLSYTREDVRWDGALTIRAPQHIDVDCDITDDRARSRLERELSSMAAHLWFRSNDQSEGERALRILDDAGHALGRGIMAETDGGSSLYRIQNDEIVQIERRGEGRHFSILTQARVDLADGRSLPTHFTVFHWDVETGRLSAADVYEDRYTEVEGLYLPAMRRIVSGSDTATEAYIIELTEHRILADK